MSDAKDQTRFTYNDIVRIKQGTESRLKPGTRGWIVGFSLESSRSGAVLLEFPIGTVYTVEFDDGSDALLPEDSLAYDDE